MINNLKSNPFFVRLNGQLDGLKKEIKGLPTSQDLTVYVAATQYVAT